MASSLPFSSLFLFLLPPTLTRVTSGSHYPCMLSSLAVIQKSSPFSMSFYTVVLLVLNSTWVGTLGERFDCWCFSVPSSWLYNILIFLLSVTFFTLTLFFLASFLLWKCWQDVSWLVPLPQTYSTSPPYST